ncbi:MAG: repair protein SbcD/Mre11 [Actinomycetota bacterium]|nr:repair protein SbcD/Mre11 [Actinomycetota bacterium]
MRFLHTGDWHIGKSIRGRSRIDEFEAALTQVIDVATTESVDCVLVAGDLHDQRAVTPDADRLIFDTFIKLYELGIPVVAIPGNHDSAARMAAFAPLLDRVGTRAVARMRRPKHGGSVQIGSRDGTETANIACLPFVSPRRFLDGTAEFDDLATGYLNFDEGMGHLFEIFEKDFRTQDVNIVLGHLFVAGAQPSGTEREVSVGADYAISAARLPRTASYIALGHIHKQQKVKGSGADTRYCGSLLQLDFGERGQDKSVLVVDVQAGKPPKVTDVLISAGRKLVEINGTIDEIEALAKKAGDAYIRVNLAVETPVPGLPDKVRALVPNALDIRLVVPDADNETATASLRTLDPKSQFVSYYAAVHGAAPADALLTAFDHVYEEVTQ